MTELAAIAYSKARKLDNNIENRFQALTTEQQQDAEVVDARDGEISLKARIDKATWFGTVEEW